jgi:hypothetical protein
VLAQDRGRVTGKASGHRRRLTRRDSAASEAPALSGRGETGAPTGAQGPGLTGDVASARQVSSASDEPTVVAARTYGGIVTAPRGGRGDWSYAVSEKTSSRKSNSIWLARLRLFTAV